MGGWWFGPRYHGGGGCLGGMIGAILAPIFVVIILLVFLFSAISGNVNVQMGGTEYDETAFQDYADDQYAQQFSDSEDYEDHILIVFLADEEYYDFYYIAWVGDHVHSSINNMLGNNNTELGRAMQSCINETNYKYSLDSNLAQVMNVMAEKIQALGLEDPYTCDSEHAAVTGKLINHTELPITESTLQSALTNFADTTGLSVVLVVEDASDVFETGGSGFQNAKLPAIILLAVIVVVIVIILISKNSKKRDEPWDNGR